jgi:hypothetical protein
MWKRPGSAFAIAAAAVLTIGLGTTQALAATWTVSPGGKITGKAGTTTLKDTTSGNSLTCKSSKAGGTAKSGSGLSGTDLASITTSTFSNCTGPLSLVFTVKTSDLPWALNAISYKSGVTKGTLTGIHATLTGSDCSATVDGTSATADNGQVDGTYTNKTHKLKILTTGGNLHVYNVSGCLGLLNNGDTTTFSGSYTITPAQTISSP